MTTRKYEVKTEAIRNRIIEIVKKLPLGEWIVTFKESSKWSDPSRAYLHIRIREVSKQVKWYGQWLSEEDWKIMFSSAMHQESRIVPGINTAFVSLGYHFSEASQKEVNDAIEFVHVFGTERGVKFSERPRPESQKGE